MKAISIAQPFASLVVDGYKDVECRAWPTKYRGPLFILSLKSPPTPEDMEYAARVCQARNAPLPANCELGGIVGMAYLADCVKKSDSPWYVPGTYGLVLTQPRPLPFIPYRGLQKLFDIDGLDYLWEESSPPVVQPRTTWLQRMREKVDKALTHP